MGVYMTDFKPQGTLTTRKVSVSVKGTVSGFVYEGEKDEDAKARIALTAEQEGNSNPGVRVHLSLEETGLQDVIDVFHCKECGTVLPLTPEDNGCAYCRSMAQGPHGERPPANLCKECGASEQDPEEAKCGHCRKPKCGRFDCTNSALPGKKFCGDVCAWVNGEQKKQQKQSTCRVCRKTPPKGVHWTICSECCELRENIARHMSNDEREMVLRYRLNGAQNESRMSSGLVGDPQ